MGMYGCWYIGAYIKNSNFPLKSGQNKLSPYAAYQLKHQNYMLINGFKENVFLADVVNKLLTF